MSSGDESPAHAIANLFTWINFMKKYRLILLLLLFTNRINAQTADEARYSTKKDVSYIGNKETDAYRKERCNLDVYYPLNKTGFQTVVWFHGGGLEGSKKRSRLNCRTRESQ